MASREGWVWASSPKGVERWYKARIHTECEPKATGGYDVSDLLVLSVAGYWRVAPRDLVFDADPTATKPEGDLLKV